MIQNHAIIKWPKEVWVGGKGPHIDTYDWSKAGPFRVGVNEAALLIPDCQVVVAVDYGVWGTLQKKLLPNILVFMEEGIKNKKFTEWPNNPVYRYKVGRESFPGFESAPHAVMLCGHFGVEIIHFVGFDGMSYSDAQHAKKGRPYSAKAEELDTGDRNCFDYAPINKKIWRALKEHPQKITPVWEHTNQEVICTWT